MATAVAFTFYCSSFSSFIPQSKELKWVSNGQMLSWTGEAGLEMPHWRNQVETREL